MQLKKSSRLTNERGQKRMKEEELRSERKKEDERG